MAARPGQWGSSCQVGLVRGGLHFPSFPGQAGGSQAAGAGTLWDGARFAQLAAPHTLSSGLSFSTPHGPPVDDHYSKGLRAGSFWNFNWELVSSFLPPVGSIYRKAETDGNGNGIVKLDQSLSKQASCQPAIQWTGKWNYIMLESQATTLPLRAGALPCGSRRLPCHQGPNETAEGLGAFYM